MSEPNTVSAEDDSIRRDRVKARWSMLRRALLGSCPASSSGPDGSDASREGAEGSFSMNAFPGFGVLDRRVVVNIDREVEVGYPNSEGDSHEQVEYSYTHSSSSDGGRCDRVGDHVLVRFRTLEAAKRQPQQGILNGKTSMEQRAEALLSHRKYGVDNTGNVRVWDAESTLAGFLLSAAFDEYDNDGVDGGNYICGVRCRHDAPPKSNDGSGNGVDVAENAGGLHSGTETEGGSLPLSILRRELKSLFFAVEDGSLPPTPKEMKDRSDIEQSKDDYGSVCRILELGAGQAGLAGLALASAFCPPSTTDVADVKPTSTKIRRLRVVLTDGHPKCVKNNEACVRLTEESRPLRNRDTGGIHDCDFKKDSGTCRDSLGVDCRLLLWDSGTKGRDACRKILALAPPPCASGIDCDRNSDVQSNDEKSCSGDSGEDEGGHCKGISTPHFFFQLCLASDCIHFVAFHDGLLCTIGRSLQVGGVALLCQPRRGKSLEQFIALVHAVNASDINNGDMNNGSDGDDNGASPRGLLLKGGKTQPLFAISLYDDFHPKVSRMHARLVTAKGKDEEASNGAQQCYDPDRHLPLLLSLKKLRRFDEDIDGGVAVRHVKERSQSSMK